MHSGNIICALQDDYQPIEFFNNGNAILNFEHIAMHCGLSRVIQLFWTTINKIYGREP